MAATAMSSLGFSAEFECCENRLNHRQFWHYHIVSEAEHQRILSGAAGDLKEAVDAAKACIDYLAAPREQ